MGVEKLYKETRVNVAFLFVTMRGGEDPCDQL